MQFDENYSCVVLLENSRNFVDNCEDSRSSFFVHCVATLVIKKGDGHLGSISAHGKLFIKPDDFIPNCQLDIIQVDLYKSKGK